MEKITLKPTIRELIYRNGEENAHFDVLSYQGAGNQERVLGSLFVVGQIKYAEEDLSYAVNLISSLAKREYYSEQSLQEQNAKRVFEHTLVKLNEVLEDFFKNKNLKLNIGLLAISGNDIYISRLGKFKVSLARDDKHIDILNNVELFSKDAESAKQFSNIISGKLHPQDKIFAYFPTRSVIAREKQLNELLVKESQEAFGQKIAHLAANANNFSACGIHIGMREIKEIPVETTRPVYTKPVLAGKPDIGKTWREPTTQKPPMETPIIDKKDEESTVRTQHLIQSDQSSQESPRIIPTEFSITKRANFLTPMFRRFSRLKNLERLDFKAKSRGFLLIVAIVIIPLLVLVAFRSIGPSGEIKSAITKARENIKLAQSHLSQSNAKEARLLLQAALSNVAGVTDKKTEEVRSEINQTLGSVNRVSGKRPQLYFDPASNNSNFKTDLVAAYNDSVVTANEAGSVFSITATDAPELAQFKTAPKFLFNLKSIISVFNGSDEFGIYNLETKKTGLYSLKNQSSVADAIVYEGNLYLLNDNSIYKYTDAVTGGTKRTVWGSDSANGTLISIAADGNVYALNSDGKLIKYFKGKKDGELDLQVVPSSGSRIFTFKDSAFLYLADKTNGWVYVFDKANGELKTTYNLSPVYGESVESAGAINDISVSPDDTVWVLSSDNKIWFLR